MNILFFFLQIWLNQVSLIQINLLQKLTNDQFANQFITTDSSYVNSIRLWDVKTGLQKAIQDGHYNGIWSVCFSPDGNILASGSDDKSIHLLDVKNKYCSLYRFKEIQVKNTRYPFFNTPLQYIQQYGLPKLQFYIGLREFFIKNRFLLGELLEQIIISYNNT